MSVHLPIAPAVVHAADEESTCQRCGFHPGRDEPQACITRVVWVPSATWKTLDCISPNGVTWYGRKTLEQVREEHPDAIVITSEEAYTRTCEAARSPVSEITKERYWEMLEVLPPCKWRGMGESFESFHVSERITGNIVSWFMRLRTINSETFYSLDDYASLTPAELATRVHAFIAAQP